MDFEDMYASLVPKIRQLKPGTVFFVKDLFEGTEWKHLSRGDKLAFGKFFKRKVELGQVPRARYHGIADNNSAHYVKA